MFYLINMISRELAINLGITLVFSIGLFVYFNSKVNKIENRVNAVFEIIQQHNNNTMEYMPKSNTQENMGEFMQMEVLEQTNDNDLVEISEDENDESDSDSDSDSDEDSDSEDGSDPEEKKLTFDNENLNEELNVESIDEPTSQNLIVDSGNVETITIEPPQNMNISELLMKKSLELDDNDSLDDVSDLDEEEMNEIEESVVKEKKPLDKWTVQELKDYAAEKKMKRYKSLTKPKLIELLELLEKTE